MFCRDPKSKALLNNDDSYYKSLLALRESKKREYALQKDVDDVKAKFDSLEKLVNQLIKTNKGT